MNNALESDFSFLRQISEDGFPPIPAIEPIADDGCKRPFWSVMIPTRDRNRYLEETVKSVIEQQVDPDEMQIEVIDNCSTKDDPEEVVKRIGGGRVSFYRQPHPVSMSENWNTCIRRAKGHWVHILHDDDMVLPQFYQKYRQLINRHHEATMIVGPTLCVDENGCPIIVSEVMSLQEGVVTDFPVREAISNWLRAPAVVIYRKTYEAVGGFRDGFSATDWEMFFRAGMYGQVVTAVSPYSLYSVHSNSETDKLVLTGQFIQGCVKALEICFSQLPKDLQIYASPTKYRWVSETATYISYNLAVKGFWQESLYHACLAAQLYPSEETLNFLKNLCKHFPHQLGKTHPMKVAEKQVTENQSSLVGH